MIKTLIKRIALPYVLILFLTAILNRLWRHQTVFIIPVIFIYATFGLIYFSQRRPSEYGIDFKGWTGCIKEALKLALLVLIPFALLFKYLPIYWTGAVSSQSHFSLGLFGKVLFYQLLVVGPAEELFFRGYLQTEISEAFTRETTASKLVLLIISAALFALIHMASRPYPGSALTFFPGLLFAWLKEKTNNIIAPSIFHSLCNLTFWILVRFC